MPVMQRTLLPDSVRKKNMLSVAYWISYIKLAVCPRWRWLSYIVIVFDFNINKSDLNDNSAFAVKLNHAAKHSEY